MSWKGLTRASELAAYLDLPFVVLQNARRQRNQVYIKETRNIKGKPRDLCYPRRDSDLRKVQGALKTKCLKRLTLNPAIRGYCEGQHNINCAESISGCDFAAKIDITSFHPSITPKLVFQALRELGVSFPMCRLIAQLTTFENGVPQGGATSNHIANVVIEMVLNAGILQFCSSRNVLVVNFGDDTAFAGNDRAQVDACVQNARQTFERFGFATNCKSTNAEHVGAERRFIGTATGRSKPDLPRKKFRKYRSRFRAALTAEL